MGRWSEAEETIEVAVKTLIPQSTDEDKVKFLQEAAIMGQFLHPNVVMLYGVVTMGEPVSLLIAFYRTTNPKRAVILLLVVSMS